jgi:glycosyltransferase involved in cell wall biosynthesis
MEYPFASATLAGCATDWPGGQKRSTRDRGTDMRIGIDAKVLACRAGGVGRYATNLVHSLLTLTATRPGKAEFVLFTAPQTSRKLLDGFPKTFDEHGCAVKSSVLRALVSLPGGIRRQRIDVFHGLDHVGIPFFRTRSKYVVTLHDVMPVMLPRMFPRKHRWVVTAALTRVCRQADVVIVPSQAVQRDVLEHLGVPEERLMVIAEGCEARFSAAVEPARLEQVRTTYGLPASYVLFVGTLEPRKNLTSLLHAFAQLRHRTQIDPTVQLVVAGARSWRDAAIYRTIKALGLEEAVCLPGFIGDADLPDLYRGAALFVFPSLYEGFGLPILEAMGCGVPVIASNTSAMPEVAGDAALLVDPHDAEALATAMAALLHDTTLRERQRARGLQRVRSFTWDLAARKTFEVYRSLGS